MVPVTGLEPVRCCHHWILSPVRLPIPPHWHVEPAVGIEPTTYCLQGSCSTFEPRRHLAEIDGFEPSEGVTPRQFSKLLVSTAHPYLRIMAEPDRIERSLTESKSVVLPLHHGSVCAATKWATDAGISGLNIAAMFVLLERMMGIEPTHPAWRAGSLPLTYTRIKLAAARYSYHGRGQLRCIDAPNGRVCSAAITTALGSHPHT